MLAEADPDLEVMLKPGLAGEASLVAVGDGRTVFRLSGPSSREVLAKCLPIDLHPRAFRPGDTALTVIGPIEVQLWQVDDAPSYYLAVPRSVAESFRHMLRAAAAEFGIFEED